MIHVYYHRTSDCAFVWIRVYVIMRVCVRACVLCMCLLAFKYMYVSCVYVYTIHVLHWGTFNVYQFQSKFYKVLSSFAFVIPCFHKHSPCTVCNVSLYFVILYICQILTAFVIFIYDFTFEYLLYLYHLCFVIIWYARTQRKPAYTLKLSSRVEIKIYKWMNEKIMVNTIDPHILNRRF